MSDADDVAARAQQLFDEGARILEATWDDAVAMCRYPDHDDRHDPRNTLDYADVLLRTGVPANAERAGRAIRAVVAMQERRPQDAHYGNFRWSLEDEVVADLNGVEFILDGLNYLVRAHAAVLPPDLRAEMLDAIALGLDEIDRLDVHPSYTNIALSDICNSVLGGEALGARLTPAGMSGDECVARGARRLYEWFAFSDRSGAPHEYNSTTYLAVDIERIAMLAAHTSDPEIALKARIAEERLWLHLAAHYHPRLAELAGPHSRSYFDGWSGASGYLKLILWKLLGDDTLRRTPPWVMHSREEAQIGVARGMSRCPDYIIELLRERAMPFESRETVDIDRGVDITTFMTEKYALGTASRAYTVGEPPEPWPSFNSVHLYFATSEAPGFGALFARYVIDDRDRDSHVELHDAGTFVAMQHGQRAIVAYGLMQQLRPARSYKLSVRMLGITPATQVLVGEQQVDDGDVVAVGPGDAVVIAGSDVYVGIIPLEPSDMGSDAPIELRRDGHALVLDIYNYQGPPKQFWEHRSQSGPFFAGNVRNAFILEVVERGGYANAEAFRANLEAAVIADNVDAQLEREITYASGGSTLSLRYSLRDMRPIARKVDGVPYASPMVEARSHRDTGNWTITRDAIVDVGQVRVIGGSGAKLLVAPEYGFPTIFSSFDNDPAPVSLLTHGLVFDCDAFGFGRIEYDPLAKRVVVDVAGEIGAIRIAGAFALRLIINGADVTEMMTPAAADGVREFIGIG